uniref:F-box domain-containing protein n=1 Tax=Steinernema glaseri TaxID=37863 RepID=A0A1I7YVK2_9BILA
MHTLMVMIDDNTGKLYAAAKPIFPSVIDEIVPLESVNLKFVTHFHIEALWGDLSISYKEIFPEYLQKLVQFIKPSPEERHPLCYDDQSCNKLRLEEATWISRKLLSMRLPVSSLYLMIEETKFEAALEEFLESAGSLSYIQIYSVVPLKHSTVDALIDKFAPVDRGGFTLSRSICLTKNQLERLVFKCGMSDKEVGITVYPEGATDNSKVTDLFHFHKHYSIKTIGNKQLTATRGGSELELHMTQLIGGSVMWMWERPYVARARLNIDRHRDEGQASQDRDHETRQNEPKEVNRHIKRSIWDRLRGLALQLRQLKYRRSERHIDRW